MARRTRKNAVNLLLAVVVAGLSIFLTPSDVPAQLMDSPWPMFKHDARHTSQSLYSGPQDPIVKWVFSPASQITTPPTIGSDGTLYVSADDGVYAVNPDGTKQWQLEIPDGVHDSQPALALDGTIYVLAYDGYLYAVGPGPMTKWRVYIGNYVSGSSPAIGSDGTVYVAGAIGDTGVAYRLFAINPTGTEKWARGLGGGYRCGGNTGPAIGPDGTIYVDYTRRCDVYGTVTRALYAFDSDGTLEWEYRFPAGKKTFGVAAAADGTTYVTSLEGLHAFNPDGTVKWEFTVGWWKGSPSIGSDGTVYFQSDYVYAINPDGTQRWRVNLGIPDPGAGVAPAIDARGVVYVQGRSGIDWQLWAINPEGTQKWVVDECMMSSHGAVISSDGTVYVSSQGRLYAIGPQVPPPIPPVAVAEPGLDSERNLVLDGSKSHDPDGTISSWNWSLANRDPAGNDFILTGEIAATDLVAIGLYDATLAITDDDGLTDTDTMVLAVPMHVLVGEDPITPVAIDVSNDIANLIDDPSTPEAAVDKLAGASGYLQEVQIGLAAGNLPEALDQVRDAVDKLIDAEEEGASTVDFQRSLAEAVSNRVQQVIARVEALVGSDNPDIVEAKSLVSEGHTFLSAGDYLAAVGLFIEAHEKVLGVTWDACCL